MHPDIDSLDLAVAVPLVVAMVELAKQTGMPSRIAGVFPLFLGLLVAVVDVGFARAAIVPGLVVGLTAAGLYSGTKALLVPARSPGPVIGPPTTPETPHGHD